MMDITPIKSSLPIVNQQPLEKRETREDGSLDVVDIFPTLQGEGPFVGMPSVFVRLAGCNLRCPACDTDYTSNRHLVKPEVLTAGVDMRNPIFPRRCLVVITGGEPFRQDCGRFVEMLLQSGYSVQFETNGTLYDDSMGHIFNHDMVTIVCSPKTSNISERLKPYVNYLKYILKEGEVDESDGLPTSSLNFGVRPCRPWKDFKGYVYVQPLDEGNEERNRLNTQCALESCMKYGYILCLQVHKLLGLK